MLFILYFDRINLLPLFSKFTGLILFLIITDMLFISDFDRIYYLINVQVYFFYFYYDINILFILYFHRIHL